MTFKHMKKAVGGIVPPQIGAPAPKLANPKARLIAGLLAAKAKMAGAPPVMPPVGGPPVMKKGGKVK